MKLLNSDLLEPHWL